MTTGTRPEQPVEAVAVRRWAAEQLNLPPDVPAREARAAFLVRLRDEDFMPPVPWQQASHALLGKPASDSLGAQVYAEEESRLRTEVESFAVEFFSLEVAGREKRWWVLREQCAFSPQLMARLRALEPGLRVTLDPAPENPNETEVAGHLRELFVLRPRERAMRRQELFNQMTPQSRVRLAYALETLTSVHPELAALEPDYVVQLASWNRRAQQRREIREKRKSETVTADFLTPPAENIRGMLGRSIVFLFLIMLAFNGLRFLAGGGSSSRPQPYVPKFTMPTMPQFSVPTMPAFDFEEWKREQERKRLLQPAPGGFNPRDDEMRRLFDPAFREDETRKRIEELRKKILEREGDGFKTPPDTRPAPRP